MTIEITINDLKKKTAELEIQLKHLKNELKLTRQEYETTAKRYYEIYSHMEKLVRERTHALRMSEKKYRSIFENIQDIYLELDMDGIILEISPSVDHILKFNREELIGKSFYLIGNDQGSIERFIETLIKKKKINDYEMGLIAKTGEKIPFVSVAKLENDKNGNPVKIIAYICDIHERKQAEIEKHNLEEMLSRSQKMEALGLLAGGVAHDLNNVLTGTVSYPDLLLADLPEDSPIRSSIITIKNSGQKAAAIVQDLLTLARRGIVSKMVINVNDIITEYLQSPEFQKLLGYHPGVSVEIKLEKDLPNIKGSPVHLKKTVMNLVSNAAEAQLDGGQIVISTESRYIDLPVAGYDTIQEGDFVILSVQDKGTGIAREDLKRIFEPFYTKKVMGRSGTGLGMAVVWGTVQDHNGYINVDSVENKGTTFSLYFPLTRESMPRRKSPIPIEDFMGNHEKILVVDDVPEQREIATKMLTKLGYRVDSVPSGETAVQYLKAQEVDLVILDMIMDPGIDGLDTYKKIIEIYPSQKAIITSGFSETDRVKEARRLGVGAYVKKPYLLNRIGLAVKEALN